MSTTASSSLLGGCLRGFILGLALAGLLPAARAGTWNWNDGGGARVTGSGHVVSENRSLSGYEALALKAPFKLELRQSGHEGLSLSGDDNLLPLVETRVIEGHDGLKTLEIGLKPGSSITSRNEIRVTVDFAKLRALSSEGSGDISGQGLRLGAFSASLSGSGDLSLKDLRADSLKLSIAGSGDFSASGQVPSFSASIAGSGDVHAAELACDDVTVNIAGSGDADVQARKTLNVSIAGSGDVYYRGAARVSQSIFGSGGVHAR
ncbi:MAG TPA: head GIN domain-containing protein [Methylibium sp.]